MVDAPPPRSCVLREPLQWERLESPFCLSHCATPNAVSLESPGQAHCPSPVQSQVQPSQVSVCQFNRAPITVRFCMEHCGVPLHFGTGQSLTGCRLHQAKPLPGVPHLFYTWEFPRSVGNKDLSENAAMTHPLCAFTGGFNPGLFSPRHLESSPAFTF